MKKKQSKNKEIKLSKQAAVYLPALQEIEVSEGILTPHSVVAAAADIDSPLHDVFLWDDTEAAKRYRLVQARMLINTIHVELLGQKTDGYVNVTIQVNDQLQRGYVPMETVMTDQEVYRQVLHHAARELEYWQKKYHTIDDLRGIVNEDKLDQIKKK